MFHILNTLGHSGLALVLIYLGIVVLAVVAAWRHRLKGLWILAAAALLSSIGELLGRIITDEDVGQVIRNLGPIIAALVALVGWGRLAVRPQACKEQNA